MRDARPLRGARRWCGGPSVRALVALAGAGGLVLAGMLWLLRHDHVGGLDRAGFRALGASRDGWLASVAEPVAALGPTLFALAVLAAIAVLVRRRAWVAAIVVVAGPILAAGAAHAIKGAEQRPRPSGGLLDASGYAFPSTDSAIAVGALAIAIAVAPLLPDRRVRTAVLVAGGALTVGAGLLFVALRVHFLSDVIAGWALGLAVFAACALAGRAVGAGVDAARGGRDP